MADCRQFQLIFNAVWKEETSRCERKPRKQRSGVGNTIATHDSALPEGSDQPSEKI